MKVELICTHCQSHYFVAPHKVGRSRYCSLACKNLAMFNRPNPKKTKPASAMHSRYKKMRVNGVQVSVHRHVAEQMLGRALLPTEAVHHINGNRYDNRPENLRVMLISDHSRLENEGKQLTASHRAKVSASLKGNQRRRGVPHTPEIKAQIAETVKRARAARFWSTKKK